MSEADAEQRVKALERLVAELLTRLDAMERRAATVDQTTTQRWFQ